MAHKKKRNLHSWSSPRETKTEKCIVLDLDETQMHSITGEDDEELGEFNYKNVFLHEHTAPLRHRLYPLNFADPETGTSEQMWGITRPYFCEFINFCFKYFRVVAVWSAGHHDYVHQVIEHTWSNLRSPHVVFTAEDCEHMCLSCKAHVALPRDKMTNDECECGDVFRGIKPLKKMWEHPVWGKYMKPENTIIIDDRGSVFEGCNEKNGIAIPHYEPTLDNEGFLKDDDVFPKLMKYFSSEKFVYAKDVRKLDKRIFKRHTLRDDD